MKTIDQWETETKEFQKSKKEQLKHTPLTCFLNNRILALIDLVRKKDEALSLVANNPAANLCGGTWDVVDNALALTEKLDQTS